MHSAATIMQIPSFPLAIGHLSGLHSGFSFSPHGSLGSSGSSQMHSAATIMQIPSFPLAIGHLSGLHSGFSFSPQGSLSGSTGFSSGSQ
jgi:hypothetical protein